MKKTSIIDSLLTQVQLSNKYLGYLNNLPVVELETELHDNHMSISIENGHIARCVNM